MLVPFFSFTAHPLNFAPPSPNAFYCHFMFLQSKHPCLVWLTFNDIYRHTHLSLTLAGPTNCTWAFAVLNTTSSAIVLRLTVSACAGPMPTYRVQAISITSGAVTVAQQVNSTVYEIPSLAAATAYDVQLVDTECPNVIVGRLQVWTDVDPSGFEFNCFYFWCQVNPLYLCITDYV